MSGSEWTAQDWVLIITAIGSLITSIIAAMAALRSKDAAQSADTQSQRTHEAVNGRLGTVIDAAKAEAFTVGHAQGFQEGLVTPVPQAPEP
jgi:membrane protein implicated in regulation of membrane protease activity